MRHIALCEPLFPALAGCTALKDSEQQQEKCWKNNCSLAAGMEGVFPHNRQLLQRNYRHLISAGKKEKNWRPTERTLVFLFLTSAWLLMPPLTHQGFSISGWWRHLASNMFASRELLGRKNILTKTTGRALEQAGKAKSKSHLSFDRLMSRSWSTNSLLSDFWGWY